jgi:hypothetical protein
VGREIRLACASSREHLVCLRDALRIQVCGMQDAWTDRVAYEAGRNWQESEDCDCEVGKASHKGRYRWYGFALRYVSEVLACVLQESAKTFGRTAEANAKRPQRYKGQVSYEPVEE